VSDANVVKSVQPGSFADPLNREVNPGALHVSARPAGPSIRGRGGRIHSPSIF